MLQVGDKLPQVNLLADNGERIDLNTIDKNMILYFYPKDNTPGCTQEAKDFAELKAEFDKYGTVIFGISKDNTKSHCSFKEKYNLNFTLLTDDTNFCEMMGVWSEKSMYGKKYMGIMRTSFLIDKNKKIIHIWPNVKVADHAKLVLERVIEIS